MHFTFMLLLQHLERQKRNRQQLLSDVDCLCKAVMDEMSFQSPNQQCEALKEDWLIICG